MNTLTIKYFLKLLRFASVMIWSVSFSLQTFASLQDASANLATANLQNFANPEEKVEEIPPPSTIDLPLYQANTPVADSSEAERYKAFSQALQKVFIKVSANPNVNNIPSIKLALKNAENFIEQFSYARTPAFQLNVHFSPDQIDNVLKKAGQPIFNQQRPSVVVWLVTQHTNGDTHLISNLSEDTLGQDGEKTLHHSADEIGLPIVFPFGDIDDLSAISSTQLWNITPKKLVEASERYGTQNILVIKMKEAKTNGCVIRWSLRPEEQPTLHWEEKEKTCQEALKKGIIKTLENLFSHQQEKNAQKKPSTPLEPPAQLIHLIIFHIQSSDDYQQVLNDLHHQSDITEVDIEKVTPTQVSYVLHVKGNLSTLMDALSAHSALQFMQKNELDNSLEYEFVGRPSASVWEQQ